jgi:hypothetical protein
MFNHIRTLFQGRPQTLDLRGPVQAMPATPAWLKTIAPPPPQQPLRTVSPLAHFQRWLDRANPEEDLIIQG